MAGHAATAGARCDHSQCRGVGACPHQPLNVEGMPTGVPREAWGLLIHEVAVWRTMCLFVIYFSDYGMLTWI